jgi:HAD superfamily phosphoserine phosphatase-like hydrolase
LEEAIRKDASTFVEDYVDGILRKQVVEKLNNHIQKGDEVYLLSSNFGFVLRLMQRMWGLSGVIATEVEIDSGRFTGRILGRSCEGKEKLARAVNCLGEDSVRASTAYGDSRGDYELLNFVKNANWV